MKRWMFIHWVVILAFSLQVIMPSRALAQENCDGFDANHKQIVKTALEVQCAAAQANRSEEATARIIEAMGSCLWGVKRGVVDPLEFFFKHIIKNIPSLLQYTPQFWLGKKIAKGVSSVWKGEVDPLEAVSKINLKNASININLWDLSKSYYESFVDFSKNFIRMVNEKWKGFWCLPWEQQMEVFCMAATTLFLVFYTPIKIIQGFKWGAEMTKAVQGFLASTKTMPGLEGLTTAEKIERAAQMMKTADTPIKEIQRFDKYRLVEYSNVKGEKFVKLEEVIRLPNGKSHFVARELPMDAKTGVINANGDVGQELMMKVFEQGKGEASLIFIDVNNLGKINYFQRGMTAGDEYLAGVSEAAKAGLRGEDLIFRTGGDEIVALVKTSDPGRVQQIAERIVENVHRSPVARQVFTQESKYLAAQYRATERATDFTNLPANVQKMAESYPKNLNFSAIKEKALAEQTELMQAHTTYRPSVSIGSTTTNGADEFSTALGRAETQASAVKVEYKQQMGLDVTKYGGTSKAGEAGVSRSRLRPVVREPVQAPRVEDAIVNGP